MRILESKNRYDINSPVKTWRWLGLRSFVFAAVLATGIVLVVLGINPKSLPIPGRPAAGGAESLPSTVKPTAEQVKSYVVASDLPKYFDIPSLKIQSRVYSAGTNSSGLLMAPTNVYDTDWYNKSAKPGQPGAMLIDGHSGLNADGVFNGLNKLKAGDSLDVMNGDGRVFKYSVVRSKIYPANNVDMSSLLVSADTARPGLNLISCTGDRIPGTSNLDERIAVFAVMQ